MTKQDYDRIKAKQTQIEQLLIKKQNVEIAKILSIKLRIFNDERTEYEDVTMTDLPKGEIKKVILTNLIARLESAQKDWEGFFNNETIFPIDNEPITEPIN